MTLAEIGKIIQAQRSVYGLSAQELADVTGISVSVIKNIEAGKRNATYNSLVTLLDAIGLTMEVKKK